MHRNLEHACEELLRYYALCCVEPDRSLSGLGYGSRTVEGKLADGELVGCNGTLHSVTPNTRHDPQIVALKRIVSANEDVFPRLIWWLYGYPLIFPCSKNTSSLVARYANKERCTERTGWNRRKALLNQVATRVMAKKTNA